MFIGFPERRSAVKENAPGRPVFPIFRMLHSLQESEIAYPLVISVTDSTATITGTPGNGDASFGSRDPDTNYFTDRTFTLEPGEREITGIRIFIVDDLRSEDNESFTLRIYAEYVGGIRRNFRCYFDDEDPVEGNYFCFHTITIVDEDGQYSCCVLFATSGRCSYTGICIHITYLCNLGSHKMKGTTCSISAVTIVVACIPYSCLPCTV